MKPLSLRKEDDNLERLDIFLSNELADYTRSKIQKWIKSGLVNVDGQVASSKTKLRGGETIEIAVDEPDPPKLVAEDIPLDVVYEDDDIIVINKAAGMVVHPGAGNQSGTLVNALLFRVPGISSALSRPRLREDRPSGGNPSSDRPGIVHRIDKDTSGLIVCAKNDAAQEILSKAFKDREVKKNYIAFCVGGFKEDQFDLKTGHARHPKDRKRYSTRIPLEVNPDRWVNPEALERQKEKRDVKVAHSRFKVLWTKDGLSKLEVDLLTGRTHQIRAHLADINHPLIGDKLYGGDKALERLKKTPLVVAAKNLTRHALHSSQLEFKHPTTHEEMQFEAPLPADLRNIEI